MKVEDLKQGYTAFGNKGNVWSDWPTFKNDKQSEILMLCSALRRVHANKDLEKIFTKNK